jgi:uncharacterized protein (DUF433 family)
MISTPAVIDVPLEPDKHGKIRVGTSRVLLELVIYAFQQGESPEGIVDTYPTLKLPDVYAVLAYYMQHRAEVDDYMRKSDDTAVAIKREIEANYSPETVALISRLRALRDEKHHTDS